MSDTSSNNEGRTAAAAISAGATIEYRANVEASRARLALLAKTKRRAADSGNPWLAAAQRFLLTIDGIHIGSFTEVTGLGAEIQIDTIEEGGQNQFVHQVPGRLKWTHLTLKRGVVDDDNLFRWFSETSGDEYGRADDTMQFRTGAISMVSDDGTPLRTWEILGALPVKWTGPSFAVTSKDIPFEELEIAHHGLRPKPYFRTNLPVESGYHGYGGTRG